MVRWLLVSTLLVILALASLSSAAALATVEVVNSRFDAAGFPNDLTFSADLRTDSPIQRAELVMQLGSKNVSVIRPATVTPAGTLSAVRVIYNIRGDAHIPPGTQIRYRWKVTTATGDAESAAIDQLYLDPRFRWQKLDDGIFSVYYYDSPESRARRVLTSMIETNQRMGALMGLRLDRQTKAMVYNSNREMIPALSFVSETTERELVREGVAYWEFDLFLTLGNNPELEDTVAHEFTHLLVGKAAGNSVPKWVNEGLAVYSQRDSSGYEAAVQQAIRGNRLLPLRALDSGFSSTPENTILAYGESGSIMRYLITTRGEARLRQLLGDFKVGGGQAVALRGAYNLTVDELDAEWRRSIGAPTAAGTAAPVASPTAAGKAATPPAAPTATPAAAAKAQPTPPTATTPAPSTSAAAATDNTGLLVVAAVAAVFVVLVGAVGAGAVVMALRNRD